MNSETRNSESQQVTIALVTAGSAKRSEGPFYTGDVGELPLDTRRVLVQLLAGPSLDGLRHGKLWPVLLRDEAVLRRRLGDLFLDLEIDRELEVAYTRQADTDDLDMPRLLRRTKLSFVDSLVVLNLRQRLTLADSYSERAVVSEKELLDDLAVFQRTGNTDQHGFEKRIRTSIKKMVDRSIMQPISGSEDRYEISPTLKLLFSAEMIASIAERYERMATGEQLTGDHVPESQESE
jgi:hypothetical protein